MCPFWRCLLAFYRIVIWLLSYACFATSGARPLSTTSLVGTRRISMDEERSKCSPPHFRISIHLSRLPYWFRSSPVSLGECPTASYISFPPVLIKPTSLDPFESLPAAHSRPPFTLPLEPITEPIFATPNLSPVDKPCTPPLTLPLHPPNQRSPRLHLHLTRPHPWPPSLPPSPRPSLSSPAPSPPSTPARRTSPSCISSHRPSPATCSTPT